MYLELRITHLNIDMNIRMGMVVSCAKFVNGRPNQHKISNNMIYSILSKIDDLNVFTSDWVIRTLLCVLNDFELSGIWLSQTIPYFLLNICSTVIIYA